MPSRNQEEGKVKDAQHLDANLIGWDLKLELAAQMRQNFMKIIDVHEICKQNWREIALSITADDGISESLSRTL